MRRLPTLSLALLPPLAILMSSCNPIPTNKQPVAYAQSLVKDAIPFYNENGRAAAVECFSSLDQVVGLGYVIILDENNVYLETSSVQLIGRDLSRLEVVNGIRSSEHIASIRTTNKWFSNVFPNPETNEKQTRLVWFVRRDGLVFTSGSYGLGKHCKPFSSCKFVSLRGSIQAIERIETLGFI